MQTVPPIADAAIAPAISDAGWRTGSACSPQALEQLLQYMHCRTSTKVTTGSGEQWIPYLASQACDVVNGDLNTEPFAEFILGRRGVKEEPGIAMKKSWRRVQLRVATGEFVEFNVHDRFNIPREMLVDLPLADELSLEWHQGLDLGRWIGGRYARYPIPNALVERLQLGSEKPRKYLKAMTNEVEEIRIAVTPSDKELPSGQKYNLVVYVIKVNAFQLTQKANVAYDNFSKWLSSCKDVTAQIRAIVCYLTDP